MLHQRIQKAGKQMTVLFVYMYQYISLHYEKSVGLWTEDIMVCMPKVLKQVHMYTYMISIHGSIQLNNREGMTKALKGKAMGPLIWSCKVCYNLKARCPGFSFHNYLINTTTPYHILSVHKIPRIHLSS